MGAELLWVRADSRTSMFLTAGLGGEESQVRWAGDAGEAENDEEGVGD